MQIALKVFTKEWDVFMKCVVGREKLSDWSKLWDDFMQKEIREGSHSRDRDRAEDSIEDHNVSLLEKGRARKRI